MYFCIGCALIVFTCNSILRLQGEALSVLLGTVFKSAISARDIGLSEIQQRAESVVEFSIRDVINATDLISIQHKYT